MSKKTRLAVLLLAGSGLAASAAQAQTADTGVLEEITVTAQRRSEKLQEVPIAVSAFTSEQLESRGIKNVYDLGSLAPNVQISTATANNSGTQISIRGGVQINPAMYWDPTVGIYLDGVYISKALGSVFDIVDLERVEVLRGPQGTLYGRNTLAGAVNLVTRAPSGEYKGEATVGLGKFNDRYAKASIDLPQMGIVKASFGGRVQRRDGDPKTLQGSSVAELNNRDQKAARAALDFDFTDTFTASYRFDYSNLDQIPMHSYLVRGDLPFLTPYVTHTRDSRVGVDGPTFERSKVIGHGLTLSWDIDDQNTLKSISAYRTLRWDDQLDLDGSPLAVAHTGRYSSFTNLSEELQLVGKAGDFNYVAGLYYYKDRGHTRNPQTFFFGTFNFDSRYGYRTTAWSGYSQVDYHVTDRLTATGGVRYTREKKGIDRLLGVNFAVGTPFIPLVPVGTTASKTFSATTPLGILSYKITDDVNAYVKYSEGFKSGGFNGEYGDVGFTPDVIANNIAETQTPFKPERQKSIEAGVKSTLDNGRLQLNAAVFQNRTSNLQLSIFRATGAASSIIRNAGKARVRGFELEAKYRPIEQLLLSGSYGRLAAKYTEFLDRGANVASNRAFIHAPKNTFNITGDAELAQATYGSWHLVADYAWTDSFYDYPFQLASSGPQYDPTAAIAGDTKIKSNGILNMRLSLRDIPLGNLSGDLSLWAHNLTDEKHIANNIDFGPGFGSLTPAYYIEPRTYGIEFTLRW